MSAYDPRPGPCLLGMAPSDSLASLTSGISSFHLPCPTPCSPLPSCQGRRHSLTRLSGRLTSSRVSLSRRSARHLLPTKEPSFQLAQFRPAQWFLKPIFHEVPQREASPLFVGRK